MALELFGGLWDFGLTSDGDLQVVNNDLVRTTGTTWFIQEMNKILRSANDWYYAPNTGVALDRFHGAINSRATANNIQNLIVSKVMSQNLSYPAILDVKVVPLSRDSIKIYVNLNFDYQVIPVSQLVYDLQQGQIVETQQVADQTSPVTPNKFPYAGKFV